jgi:hypothetical protein
MVLSTLPAVRFAGLDSHFLGYSDLRDYFRPRLRSSGFYRVSDLDPSCNLRYGSRTTVLMFNNRDGKIREARKETRDDFGEISPAFY